MAPILKHIVKAAVCITVGIALAETAIVVVDAVKTRKQVNKLKKEDEPKMKISEAIISAAKKRVDEIKKDPKAEIISLAYGVGLWMGDWCGTIDADKRVYKGASNAAIKGLFNLFRQKAPDEFNSMIEKLKETVPNDVAISQMSIKQAFSTYTDNCMFNPSKVKLAKVIDTVAKEVI